jgi:hypothetical protein
MPHALVHGDTVQPSSELCLGAETANPSENTQENFLGDVCRVRLAHHARYNPVYNPAKTIIELSLVTPVSSLATGDDFGEIVGHQLHPSLFIVLDLHAGHFLPKKPTSFNLLMDRPLGIGPSNTEDVAIRRIASKEPGAREGTEENALVFQGKWESHLSGGGADVAREGEHRTLADHVLHRCHWLWTTDTSRNAAFRSY